MSNQYEEMAREIVRNWLPRLGFNWIMYQSELVTAIADALRDAARVKDGCVRLPDGRDVRVSNIGMSVLISMADGDPWKSVLSPHLSSLVPTEAAQAAAAARKEGE